MVKKVLFLGCNFNQIPYIIAAKKLGLSVIGTDINCNAPGGSIVDSFYCVGYTDIEGLLNVAEKECLDATDQVFTASAHFAYEGAAKLAAIIGIPFPTPETIDICIDKTKFYNKLSEYDLLVPPTNIFNVKNSNEIDLNGVYYLKSDYGKTPSYIYRITNGKIPALPKKHDQYFRKIFLIQEEVKGIHYRINIYSDNVSTFLKISDTIGLPLQNMGFGHNKIIFKLKKLLKDLGLNHMILKFDLIVNDDGYYVIDIGLDPPQRMQRLFDYLGYDFPTAYVQYYLLDDTTNLTDWDKLCVPVIIKGTVNNGNEFISLEE